MDRPVHGDAARMRRSAPRVLTVVGIGLVLLGLAGTWSACQPGAEPVDLWAAGLSGMALAIGAFALVLGRARRGYHSRPLGSPPGDMDPERAQGPPPEA